jgi:hypothetical protein
LEGLVEEADKASVMAVPRLFDRVVVGAVAWELLEVAELRRAEPSNARGVALVSCLISDGIGSPLHRGGDVAALRGELGGIRFLLSDGSVGRNEPVAVSANPDDSRWRAG